MSLKDSAKVAESYDKLYSELPSSLTGQGQPHSSSEQDNREALKAFLRDQVPQSDQKELEKELKKTAVLRKQRGQKKLKTPQPKRRPKGKPLSSRERRRLGLYKLPKRCMKFGDLDELNAIWVKYVKDLVDLDKYRGPGDDNVQMRLCRADYHGALVKITKSNNASVIGFEGYVVMETRNTFRILGRDDVLRTVPKVNTSFTFRVEDHLFTVGGSQMMIKPSDRAVKKWKAKGPMNL